MTESQTPGPHVTGDLKAERIDAPSWEDLCDLWAAEFVNELPVGMEQAQTLKVLIEVTGAFKKLVLMGIEIGRNAQRD